LSRGSSTAESIILRLATLAPEGSTWMRLIDEWAKEVAARSRGRPLWDVLSLYIRMVSVARVRELPAHARRDQGSRGDTRVTEV
jgi:hypothetical protein